MHQIFTLKYHKAHMFIGNEIHYGWTNELSITK